mgnify:CR=1 FL=1
MVGPIRSRNLLGEKHPKKRRRNETREARRAEQAWRCRREDSAAHQAGADVAGEQHVIKLKESAKRKQDDARPNAARHRQTVDARADQPGIRGRLLRLSSHCGNSR